MEAELPRYFGSTGYWLRRAAGVPVAHDALFDKRRKEIHRFIIADVNGPLILTLPIVKPHGKPYATWRDVCLSDHGNWWHIHRTALESAYGRTPFFEFYIDRFLPFLAREAVDLYPSIIDFNEALDAVIAPLLLLPVSSPSFPTSPPESSNRFVLRRASALQPAQPVLPYWQPRSDRFGFLADLSILDLIFCLGPEAPLWIRDSLSVITHQSAPACSL